MRGTLDYDNIGSFFIYLILSFLFFGRGLAGHLSDRYMGIGQDPGVFIFALQWWKYVLTNHLNPFVTPMVWEPTGANLAWTTALIPLFGIFEIPITSALGPVASYNLLMLLCPALGAWGAFLLCRHLCSGYWSALVGGYVFGFSSYILAHLLGHPNLIMVFALPLIVEVTLLRLCERLGIVSYTIALSTLMIVQFLCCPELLATATIFGCGAIAVAWLIAPQWRSRLLYLVPPVFCAYTASAIILTPYLYYFFASVQQTFPGGLNHVASVHPPNLLIPSPTNLLGTFSVVRNLCRGSHIYEAGAYMALPMLIIVATFARSPRRDWQAKLLLMLLVIVCVSSLGSSANIWSHTITLPWAIAAHLPLINKALPERFSIYVFLILAIVLSLWLSDDAVSKSLRVVGACSVVLFTLPNLNSAFWATPLDTPAFFSNGDFKHYIAPGENVLVLPYGLKGNSQIWQTITDFYFRMAGGFVGPPLIPQDYQQYFPLVYNFYNLAEFPFSSEILKAFLVQKRVNAIIVADEGAHLWTVTNSPGPWIPKLTALSTDQEKVITALFATLGVVPLHIDGVSFYKVPLERLDDYRNLNPRTLESRIVAAQLATLITAANQYLSDYRLRSDLNPRQVQRLGLLPPHWVPALEVFSSSGPLQNGLVLTALNNGDVLLGVVGAENTIESLATIYKPYAKSIEASSLINRAGWAEYTRWILLMTYDRARLSRVAALVSRQPSLLVGRSGISIGPSLE